MMAGDVAGGPLPIATRRRGACPRASGWASRSTRTRLREAARRYELDGQFLPYQREQLGREERP